MIRKTAIGISTTAMLLTALLGGCGTNSTAGNNTSSSGNAQTQNTSSANTTTGTTSNQTSGTLPTSTLRWSSPPSMQIDTNKQYSAIFHTNYGDFTVQLFAKDSPHTVNNFVFLAEHHFYNNDEFFRIIQAFMIQTGDPNNNGTGGPGYKFNDELPPKQPYTPGIVAMANAGANTNGSQFFICTGPESQGLQNLYTQFGKVVSGMNVVDKIAAIPVVTNPMTSEPSYPTKIAYIKSIDIVVK